MKIFDFVKLRNSGDICQKCVHFQNEPALIEKTYPGLTSMSSGYASVRARDGLCNFNQVYLSAGSSCSNFTAIGT